MGLFVLFFLGRDRGLPAKPENIREAPSVRRSERAAEGGKRGEQYEGSSYACMVGLMSPLGSCLIAGETMAGCGMPVWWRLCGGGVTM